MLARVGAKGVSLRRRLRALRLILHPVARPQAATRSRPAGAHDTRFREPAPTKERWPLALAAILVAALATAPGAAAEGPREWPAYGGGPASIRVLDARPDPPRERARARGGVDVRLRGVGRPPGQSDRRRRRALRRRRREHRVVALDAATGAVRWTFDSGIPGERAQPRRDLLGGARRSPHLRRAGPVPVRAGRPHRQARDGFGRGGRIDLRERPGPAAREAVGAAHDAGQHVQAISSSWGDASAKACRRRPGTSARTTRARARCAGGSARSRIPGEDGLRDLAGGRLEVQRRRQQLGRHGGGRGARNRVRADGIGRRGLLRRRTASATTFSRTACWPSTRRPVGGSGTSRRCATTSGTATSRLRPAW